MSAPEPYAVLAIDDDTQNLNIIREALDQQNLQIITTRNPTDGFAAFLQVRPRIVLLGVEMPDVSGLELLERMLAVDPGLDVILVAPQYSAESAVAAIQKGASDYMTQPLDVSRLRTRIVGLLADAEQRLKTLRLDHELLEAYRFEGIVGRSPLMLEVFAQVRRIAPHFRTVLVTGATGTGKELIAHALHRLSPAARGRFVVCNCSALVDTLMENELFGHVRGSFTGAVQDKPGLFEHADGGTIFLDEIGELSAAAQAKLLRVLQDRQVQRIGSVTPRSVNVRVVAATHRNLKAMVRDGQFREDLYYRLAVVEIHLPSLASRREDLPLLVRHFLDKCAAEYGKPIAGLARRAQLRMAAYPWPGNVRELENVIGNACMMGESSLIDINDLPERFRERLNGEVSTDDTLLSLEEVQRRHVLRVLEGVGGNKARAAEVLGIGRATIYQLLSRMKLTRKARDESA
ncbi:MAG: sigma-54 dependent transcriptional regulator [Candidatus Sulfotelmatobacter sp.]|jgi:DNA-binding NtrC family response regulator